VFLPPAAHAARDFGQAIEQHVAENADADGVEHALADNLQHPARDAHDETRWEKPTGPVSHYHPAAARNQQGWLAETKTPRSRSRLPVRGAARFGRGPRSNSPGLPRMAASHLGLWTAPIRRGSSSGSRSSCWWWASAQESWAVSSPCRPRAASSARSP